jgi:hypothetical protein
MRKSAHRVDDPQPRPGREVQQQLHAHRDTFADAYLAPLGVRLGANSGHPALEHGLGVAVGLHVALRSGGGGGEGVIGLSDSDAQVRELPPLVLLGPDKPLRFFDEVPQGLLDPLCSAHLSPSPGSRARASRFLARLSGRFGFHLS